MLKYIYIKYVVSTSLSGNATGDNFCVHKTVPDYRVVRMCPALKTSISEFGFFLSVEAVQCTYRTILGRLTTFITAHKVQQHMRDSCMSHVLYSD